MTSRPPASARLPLSAIVASRNEARDLDRCLASLHFCDELIVIDLSSSDDTTAVAARHGARVVAHEPVTIAEQARITVVSEARHSWLLFTDPDEELPAALAEELAALLPTFEQDIALVWAPIRFYIGSRPLHGTIWGGENRRRLLVRSDGVDLLPRLFGGVVVREDFRELSLPFSEKTAIRHHWVTGYGDWIEKHRRYLRLAGKSRADAGEIGGARSVLRAPFAAFVESFLVKRGYRDGVTGLALSLLWGGYAAASEVALVRELQRRVRAPAG